MHEFMREEVVVFLQVCKLDRSCAKRVQCFSLKWFIEFIALGFLDDSSITSSINRPLRSSYGDLFSAHLLR
eukprot:scaffold6712_cov142-Cylindrotheca_fusiformis.AAC.7